jgi:hypothetical protein
MSGIRKFLSRLWQTVTGLLQPVWRFITRWTRTIHGTVVSFLHGVRERHQHRIDVDPSYPVALATGSTAAVGVLAASPAVAAAVGVLVTQLLGVNDRHSPTRTRATSWRRPWEEEPYRGDPDRWDDDSTRLWERTDWDE